MTREERREHYRKLKEERRKQQEAWQQAREDIRENARRAEFAEKEGIGLLGMSRDPLTNRPPTDLQGELRIAKQWVKLLGLESPVMKGTTLKDLLRRLFYAWQKVGFKLWNPFVNRFSEKWVCEPTGKNFEDSWTFLEGQDYEVLLNAADFADEPKTEPATKNEGQAQASPADTTAEKTKTAAEQLEEWQKTLGKGPKLFYSGEVAPYAGEEE